MHFKPKKLLIRSIARMLTPKGVIAIGITLWAGVIALCGWIVYQSYMDAVRLAEQSSYNLLQAIERDLVRTVNSYDLSLQAVISGAQDARIMALPADLRNGVLFDNSATARYFGTIVLLDARGRIIADSSSTDLPPRYDFSDRKSYLAYKEDPSLDFRISPPYASKHRAGATEIAISHRIGTPGASFAGVVIGTINIDYFRSLLDGLDLKRSGAAAILMTDGSLLARVPDDRGLTGQSVRSGSLFQKLIQKQSGYMWGTTRVDSVERLHVFKRVPNLPMVIDIAMSENDILADWKGRSLLMLVLGLLFTLVVLPTSFLFAHELRRRQESEIELHRQAHEDPLTGLDNRGTFDRSLQKACAVSMRTGLPVSLLFLDLDKFKAYNDTYGHQAGDDALKSVTAIARRQLKRPTDHFARYGGEEFVAILEATGGAQAALVAEGIRAAVENIEIAHSGSPTGFVTVSIGVASARAGVPPQDLVGMADEALYDAKSAGGNRVMQFLPMDRTVSATSASS